MHAAVIMQLGHSDGRRLRAVRLWALADAPDAFASTHERESRLDDDAWTARLADPRRPTWVAVLDGSDDGLVTAVQDPDDACAVRVVSMWVAPSARGRGVGGALLRRVVEHGRAVDARRVTLWVADRNEAALRLYRRHGFVPTGRTAAFDPPREHMTERQLVLEVHDHGEVHDHRGRAGQAEPDDSSRDRSRAASIAVRNAARTLWSSSWRSAAIVVPAGLDTCSRSTVGCSPVSRSIVAAP